MWHECGRENSCTQVHTRKQCLLLPLNRLPKRVQQKPRKISAERQCITSRKSLRWLLPNSRLRCTCKRSSLVLLRRIVDSAFSRLVSIFICKVSDLSWRVFTAKVKFREDPSEVRFDRVARFYDTFNFIMERFASKHRKEILRQARGNILEVGVGTGSSFKDYPPDEQIVAVDISQEMLRRAEEKLKNFNGKVELRREDVQNLSFKDESFDTVFTSWVFCSVSEPVKGLTEVRRVLKKDGVLLMLEHVKSKNRILGFLMDRLNPLVARVGVDNINRDTVANLRKAGFKVLKERNIAYDVVKVIVAA